MLGKTILITGGSGFIGTHLCKKLLQNGHQITIADLVPSKLQHPNLTFINCDIRNTDEVNAALTIKFDAVFHFAAIVSVPECEQNPQKSFLTNHLGTQIILNRLKELSDEKIIPIFFASSAAVYGDLCKPGMKLRETDNLPAHSSFYGLHKYSSEQTIRLYCKKMGLRGLSFRFFNVFGPGQNANSPYSGVITVFEHAFDNNLEVKLYNHGNNARDFIHVHEIVRACELALGIDVQKLDGSPINLCSGNSIYIKELFKQMCELKGFVLNYSLLPSRAGDIEYSCGNQELANKILGFTAKSFQLNAD